jgi:hypothetical protein
MKRLFACHRCWIAAGLVCGLLVVLLIRSTEPRYQGRALSEWAADVPLPPYQDENASNAVNAVRQIGPRALPFLLRQLQTRESPLRSFQLWLKKKLTSLPLSTRSVDQIRLDACVAIIALGPEAEPALAELTQLLHVPEFGTDVAGLLPFFGHKGYLALTTGLTNAHPQIRLYSAANLISPEARPQDPTNEAVLTFRREAKVAIPALIQALNDPDPNVLQAVITALGYLRQEPERVLPALEKFLVDTESRAAFYKSPRRAAQAAIASFAAEGVAPRS